MTVIVSVKINDGIVMAADSASTFANGMTYLHANKIVNLVKGLPIGAMGTGNGSIGNESVETLLKDLRARFSGRDDRYLDWEIDPSTLSMQAVAEKVREFFVVEKAKQSGRDDVGLLVRLCGYSVGRPLAEIWDVNISESMCDGPNLVQAEDSFGPRWHGEFEALDRLIFGIGPRFNQVVLDLGLSEEQLQEVKSQLIGANLAHLSVPAMPIQDTINLAKFLADTTIGFVKYSFDRPVKTVGGPVEIATITKHEGFKWVDRKHFFPANLN